MGEALTSALDWGPLWLIVFLLVLLALAYVLIDDEHFSGWGD